MAPPRARATGPRRLRNILDRLYHATGRRVVVLVDAYDKSVLDMLQEPDLATANRSELRGLCGIIKASTDTYASHS